MSVHEDFRKCLYLTKIFGILSFTFDEKTSKLIVRKTDRIWEIFMQALNLVTTVTVIVIFYTISLKSLYAHQTGDMIVRLQLILGLLVRIFSITSIYCQRKKNFKIVRHIFELLISAKQQCQDKSLRRSYITSLVLTSCLTLNIWKYIINGYVGNKILFIVSVSSILPNGYVCVFLSLFDSVIISVRLILESFNTELYRLTSNHQMLNKYCISNILRIRSNVLTMCAKDINEVYGISIGLIAAQIFLLLASLPVAISEVVSEWQIPLLGKFISILNMALSGLLPMVALFCMAFMSSDLEKEANKTARILSRVSLRGTDIEKMVDKFLMKNMQQKPILTAYGFFPLNKRTLFKIFAAIFTYMVILIQFKDMENTNKLLVSIKSTTLAAPISS